jgi:hypothetical protein
MLGWRKTPLVAYPYAFFSYDLVDPSVDIHGGASAFINDFFRWRVGRFATYWRMDPKD